MIRHVQRFSEKHRKHSADLADSRCVEDVKNHGFGSFVQGFLCTQELYYYVKRIKFFIGSQGKFFIFCTGGVEDVYLK